MPKAENDTIGLDVPWTRFSFGDWSPVYDPVELAIRDIAQLVDVVRFGKTSLFWYRWDILKVQALFSTPETEKKLKIKGKTDKMMDKNSTFPSNFLKIKKLKKETQFLPNKNHGYP